MAKRKRFRKVVQWGNIIKSSNIENFDDQFCLVILIPFMIPVLGQILWLLYLTAALGDRKIYWEEE